LILSCDILFLVKSSACSKISFIPALELPFSSQANFPSEVLVTANTSPELYLILLLASSSSKSADFQPALLTPLGQSPSYYILLLKTNISNTFLRKQQKLAYFTFQLVS